MIDPTGIPSGWTLTRLGDILPLNYGKSLPEKQRQVGDVRVFGSNGEVGTHSIPLTKGKALVVGRKGAAGEVHYSPAPCWVIDTAYWTDERDFLELKYFFYLLRYLQLGQLDRSTAIPSLSRDDYDAVIAPLAPQDDQRRIVAKIEELFSDLDAGVAALERVRANLKRYRAAVLKAAVEGKLTEEWRAQHPDTEPASVLLERILIDRRRKRLSGNVTVDGSQLAPHR